jgi:hypothetical protein
MLLSPVDDFVDAIYTHRWPDALNVKRFNIGSASQQHG